MAELAPIGDSAALIRTRTAWHSLAEHVLASARHRACGRIGLRAAPGGFGTPPYEWDGTAEELEVVGNELLVRRDDATVAHPLTTLADAAQAVGIEPGAPAGVYTPTTALDPDAPLAIDLDAARVLAAWFGGGWSVLEELATTAAADATPSAVTLWPEHFDAAIELGSEDRGTRGTFGVSPGDGEHLEPYLYVTHSAAIPDDAFWNDTAFAGASVAYESVGAATNPRDAMLDFFRAGLERLSAASA